MIKQSHFVQASLVVFSCIALGSAAASGATTIGATAAELGVLSELSGEAGGLYMEGGLRKEALSVNPVQGKNSLVGLSRPGKVQLSPQAGRRNAPNRSTGPSANKSDHRNPLDKFLDWVGPQGTPKYFLVGLGLAVAAAAILSAAFPAGIPLAAVLGIVGGVIAVKLIADYRNNQLPWQNPR